MEAVGVHDAAHCRAKRAAISIGAADGGRGRWRRGGREAAGGRREHLRWGGRRAAGGQREHLRRGGLVRDRRRALCGEGGERASRRTAGTRQLRQRVHAATRQLRQPVNRADLTDPPLVTRPFTRRRGIVWQTSRLIDGGGIGDMGWSLARSCAARPDWNHPHWHAKYLPNACRRDETNS